MTKLCLAALLCLASGACLAQPAAPSPPSTSAPNTLPPPQSGSDVGHPAVIHPGNPDPGITVKPGVSGTMPVIPPPGSAGSNPTVVPK